MQIVESVSRDPSAGLPQLMAGDAELEGLYRFLSNSNVSLEAIIAPHLAATARRLPEEDFVIAHDTTELRFDGRAGLESLGRLQQPTTQGFFAHCALALTLRTARRAQGLLHLGPMFRDKERAATGEGLRWFNGVHESALLLGNKKSHAVHVMDREADSYHLFWQLLEGEHRFVIRTRPSRRLVHEQQDTSSEIQNLDRVLPGFSGFCEREVELSRRKVTGKAHKDKVHPPRAKRTATLRFSANKVFVRKPRSLMDSEAPQLLGLNVVDVSEPNPPQGCEPISWVLISSEPIETPQQVERIVDCYRARWAIEEYFKALKTGCAFEKRQLKSKHALLSALGIFSVIAWQLLVLRDAARTEPLSAAADFLSATQLELLRFHQRSRNQKPLAAQPTLEQAVRAIAKLGGHITNNGPPGWLVLSRGFENLLLMEVGWRAANTNVYKGSCDQ